MFSSLFAVLELLSEVEVTVIFAVIGSNLAVRVSA